MPRVAVLAGTPTWAKAPLKLRESVTEMSRLLQGRKIWARARGDRFCVNDFGENAPERGGGRFCGSWRIGAEWRSPQ